MMDSAGVLNFAAPGMAPAAPLAEGRLVMRDAALVIEVEKDEANEDRDTLEAASKQAATIAKELKGWVVHESRHHVSLRIPAESLDAALARLSGLGEVTEKSISGTDVTDQYRDTAIRLDNLEKSRKRYLALLENAEDVKAALGVEKELQRVTLEIERLKGQQQRLEKSVQYSLVSVSLRHPRSEPMPGPLGWIFYGLWYAVKWLFVWE